MGVDAELRMRDCAYRVFGAALLSDECAERLAGIPDEIIPAGMLRNTFLPAVRRLVGKGVKVTPDVLCTEVQGAHDAEGVTYEMLTSVDSPELQEYYLMVLRDWAVLKRFKRILAKLEKQDSPPLDVVSREVERAAMLYQGTGGVKRLADAAEGLDELSTPPVTSTGTAVDSVVTIKPGHLVFIAGTPGMGKTSLAIQIADLSARDGLNVLFVSLEMSAEEIAARLCSRHGLTEPNAMREYLQSLPLYYECCTSPAALRATVKAVSPDVVIVDYIGLMSADSKDTSRTGQLAEISRSLKLLARTSRCPVIALSQLNRKAAEGTPQLHHLRDSGTLEADADAVIIICPADASPGQTERTLLVAKNRHGAVGEFAVRFQAPSCTWE